MKLSLGAIFLLFLIIITTKHCTAQPDFRDTSVLMPMVQVSWIFQVPAGDMQERFGPNSNVGFAFGIKLPTHWYFAVEGNAIYGDKVKEDIFTRIKTSNDIIINKYGEPANYFLNELGFMFSIKAGRLFPVIGPNPNSGIYTIFGAGLLQHQIWIGHQENNTPQIMGDFVKGYDRLTNGLMISQFIGYQNISNRSRMNYYIGFEICEAFTQSRRNHNIDLMARDNTKRFDILYGIKLGWIIPMHRKLPDKYYYY